MKTAILIKDGFYCPYCHKHNGVNEGSSETYENGDVIITCGYCNKEAISDRIE